MRIPKKKYGEYINSKKWLNKREEVFNEKGRKCEKCGTEHNLQIHHGTYIRLGNELLTDLFVLCDSCHFELHGLCGLQDLLRNTKRFIQGLPYEKRSAQLIRKDYRKQYLEERKRVRREARKRAKLRKQERMKQSRINPSSS